MLFTQLREYSQSIYFRRNAEITSSLFALSLSSPHSLSNTEQNKQCVDTAKGIYGLCLLALAIAYISSLFPISCRYFILLYFIVIRTSLLFILYIKFHITIHQKKRARIHINTKRSETHPVWMCRMEYV